MTQQEFASEMERLKSAYEGNKSAFPAERTKLIYNAVKNKSAKWMESAVNHFIGNYRQPPLLKDFIERLEEDKEMQSLMLPPPRDSLNATRSDCALCNGLGYTFDESKSCARIIYRCICSAGARQPSHELIPIFGVKR